VGKGKGHIRGEKGGGARCIYKLASWVTVRRFTILLKGAGGGCGGRKAIPGSDRQQKVIFRNSSKAGLLKVRIPRRGGGKKGVAVVAALQDICCRRGGGKGAGINIYIYPGGERE